MRSTARVARLDVPRVRKKAAKAIAASNDRSCIGTIGCHTFATAKSGNATMAAVVIMDRTECCSFRTG